MDFGSIMTTVLGILFIVLGFFLRQKRMKFLSGEYGSLTEEEKKIFESEHDMDKYWNSSGNMLILTGLSTLLFGIGIITNSGIISIIAGIIMILAIVYLGFFIVVKEQYINKK